MYFITILFDVHRYNFVSRVHAWLVSLLNLENDKFNVTIFDSNWIYLIL